MARGIGIALRGAGKALGKQLKKAPALGKYAKAGAARGMRGQTVAEKYRKALGDPGKQLRKAPKKKPIIGKFEKGIGTGVALTYAYLKLKESGKTKKDAKAKEDKKLKEATEKHKEEDEKRKKAYGKRAPKNQLITEGNKKVDNGLEVLGT